MMRFESPTSVDEAIGILADNPGRTHVLGGGTDLLVQLRSGLREIDLVVDLRRIEALNTLEAGDAGLRIGAAVSSATLNKYGPAKADWPSVCEAARLIGSTQIQSRATLAGNLCNASPAADSVPAMVAANAVANVVGPNGKREVPVERFNSGPGQTTLESGEIVESILLPRPSARSGSAYQRFIPRTEMDIAVVGVAVCVTLDESGSCVGARAALGAVAPTVILADRAAEVLIGGPIDVDALEEFAEACSAQAQPIDDKRGTTAFRHQVVRTLARRTGAIAAKRASEKA